MFLTKTLLFTIICAYYAPAFGVQDPCECKVTYGDNKIIYYFVSNITENCGQQCVTKVH